MPKIVFVRPCETQTQDQGLMVGRTDLDLNETGHTQAGALAQYMQSWPISRIAVSPMKRALSTALYLCEENNRIPQLISGFQATDLGEWDGKPKQFVLEKDGARFERWRTEPDFPCPGGESIRNIYRRSFCELVDLVALCEPDELLVIIAPAMILRVMTCGILDLPLTHALSFALNHGAVSTFTRLYPSGPYQMSRWNDISYQYEPMLALDGSFPGELP
ncbi:MAG: histidine phosphatase family protein [Acidobacteria bacterium]|nr:histidine phosphatase family protein [Acidobacteriota bacterium]MCB9398577.1 histidine phosphatase family protein [Acidobacteriota bacterium]